MQYLIVLWGKLWNEIGSHLISVKIGIVSYQWFPSGNIAAGSSFGLAIGVMCFTLFIHPPKGTTALAAVIGRPIIQALLYQYILTPIAIKTAAIFLAAFLFNHLFHWRLYSRLLLSIEFGKDYNKVVHESMDHVDFVYAPSKMQTLIEITENYLLSIFQAVTVRKVNLIK